MPPPGFHCPSRRLDRSHANRSCLDRSRSNRSHLSSMSSRNPTPPGINALASISSLWPQLGAASWGPCPSDLKPQMEFHCESEPEFASRPPQRLTSKYRSGSIATEVPFARCNEGVMRRCIDNDRRQKPHLRPTASGEMIKHRQNYTVAANTNRMAALSAPMTASGMTSSWWLCIVYPALEFAKESV